MSGELTLSQFKATTTQNNDFVIGNPIPSGSTDTSDRYLVFQVSDKVGPMHNPHVRCEYTGSAWRIKLSDNGVTDSDFAFLNTGTALVPQNFIGVNAFNGTTNFIGTVNTGTINLGYSPADTITFNGSPVFTGPLTFNSPVTFQSDVTISAPTHNVNITANSLSASTKTLLLNKGVNIGAGGLIGIEVANVITPVGYIKTLSDNTGWQVKAPQNAGTVTFIPSLSASDLIIKPVHGDFGPGNVRTFEFLNGNGYVGGYNIFPVGDRVVLSTPTGFKESTITATTFNFLSNVTSDIQSQLTANNGVIFTLNSRVDSAESNLSIALATMSTNQSTNASLITALDSRVTNAEATITSCFTTFSTDLALTNVLRSKTYSPGTTSAPPVGFKLSGVPFDSTLLGDSSPTSVQMELGAEANFGGYKVGNITDKVFAAAATAYYNNLGLTVQYPWSSLATSGMPFVEKLRSGVSVSYDTTTNINSFVSQAGGIYTIDIAFQAHGAAISYSSMNVYCAIKRTSSAYFSELIFHDWNFLGSGRSEPHVSGSVAVELFAGDKIAFFYDAPGMSYLNAYVIMTNSGSRAASDVLTIITPTTLYTNLLNGITPNLSLDASNAYGDVSWSLDGGTTAGVTIVDNSLKCPDSVGTYTCNLRVIDSKTPTPQQATKTTTVTVASAAPLTVSNLPSIHMAYDSTDFPVNVDLLLTASGAVGPVTWTVLSCDTPDIYELSGGTLHCYNIEGATTITSVVKAHTAAQGDSATVTLTTYIRVITSTDYLSCFGRGTLVLMNDGSSKPIETIVAGDLIKAISADSHQSGLSDVITATVNERIDGKGYINKMVSVDGILSTSEHPWAVINHTQKSNIFWPAQALSREYYHRVLTGKELKVGELQASIPIDAGTEEEVYTIYTTAGAYFVGSSESGPWYLVHNQSIY